jgi:hypothetical protein
MRLPNLTFNTPRGCAVFLILVGFSISLPASPSPNSQFTVEIVTPNSVERTLVETNASWRYFKGTSEPNTGWDTAESIFLGSAWKTNLGGFGYGDADDRTVLPDMQNGYSTLYVRTTFSHDEVLNASRLKLKIDYDDGFIAYLDGKEFARVNAPGAPGQRAPHNSVATASHEASRGPGGNPAETWHFDADFVALFPHASEGGDLVPHVLAIQGLNYTLTDDDFSLIPSLYLEDFFTRVSTSSVQLAGRLNLVGANAVLVNGEPAVVDFAAGTWSITHPLKSGMNRLTIEARDCDNNVLVSRTKDVLSKVTSRLVSGTISSNTSWDASQGIVEVTGNITVSSGVTLTIGPGTTVLFRPGTALGTISGSIYVVGTASNRIYFLPSDGRTAWGGLAAGEEGSSLILKFAELVAGGIYMTNHANVLVEDSTLRDFSYDQGGFERYMAYGSAYCRFVARRSTFSRYYTIVFGGETSLEIEDCHFEYAEHDFLKPQDTTPGSVIRRCTFAHGPVAGTDAVDTGANAKITVDNCAFYNVSDKAISIEASTITVRNSLIYNCGTGLAIKDDSEVILNNNTIVSNLTYGIAVYLKNAGAVFAHAAVTNCIIWGNATNITLRNPDTGAGSPAATIDVRFSDVGGTTNYFGTGNIRTDPRFIKSSAGDFRLASESPAIGSGAGDVNMGGPYLAGAGRPTVLLQQPLSQTAALTSNVTLRVTATGALPIFYQWRFNNADIAGATSSSLVVSNLNAAKEGTYKVLASNRENSVHSSQGVVLRDSPMRLDYSVTDTCRYNLRLSGPAGKRFILERSSDLLNWTSFITNAAATGIIEFKDGGLAPSRFYRAAYLP